VFAFYRTIGIFRVSYITRKTTIKNKFKTEGQTDQNERIFLILKYHEIISYSTILMSN
jgi:hypothetical protein